MKKCFILTSVLALAACSGGSGGGGAPGVSGGQLSGAENFIRSGQTTIGNVEINNDVTSMASAIVVAKDGSSSAIRSATKSFNGKEYDIYDLSDVKFNATDEGFGLPMQFIVGDDKVIRQLAIQDNESIVQGNKIYIEYDDENYILSGTKLLSKLNEPGYEIQDSGSGPNIYYNGNPYGGDDLEIANNNIYRVLNTVPDGMLVENDKIYTEYTGDHRIIKNNEVYELYDLDSGYTFKSEDGDINLTYASHGKDMKLKYSDFGFYQFSANNDVDRPVPFIGGYDDVKKIESDELPTSETTFTGNAIASVISILGGENSGTVYDPQNNGGFINGSAELKFTKDSENLTARFEDWYDVSYNNGNLSFDGTSKTIPDAYKLFSNASDSETNSKIQYYGDNGTPSEAVGLIQYRQCANGTCDTDYDTHQEIRMNLSFGAKAQ